MMRFEQYRTYDDELILIAETFTSDSIGNQVATEVETPVLCRVESAGRREFYAADATGLKPTVVFVVHAYEYSDETKVEFGGVRYNIIRTYRTDFEEIELVCEKVIGSDH